METAAPLVGETLDDRHGRARSRPAPRPAARPGGWIRRRRRGLRRPRSPCATPASTALAGVGELAAVGEAVGRDVEDAHDLRLVEPDGAVAQAAAAAAARSAAPKPLALGGIVVDASRSAARPGRSSVETRREPSHCDQLDRGEPVQAAGKPRDLAVMAERGIDETRRADEACVRPSAATVVREADVQALRSSNEKGGPEGPPS